MTVTAAPWPTPVNAPVTLDVRATDDLSGAPVAGTVTITHPRRPGTGPPTVETFATNVRFTTTLRAVFVRGRPGGDPDVLYSTAVARAPGYADVPVDFGLGF
jgi:hypothetical protein